VINNIGELSPSYERRFVAAEGLTVLVLLLLLLLLIIAVVPELGGVEEEADDAGRLERAASVV
jgi:hypothetical protein